jgi:hypothetical protein
MSMFLPHVLLHRACLASWCTVQCSMECYIVSSFYSHSGQIGEATFPMWCKCLAGGIWPVLSCNSMLAIFRGRHEISLMYLSKDDMGSVFFILVYYGDFCHIFCALCFSVSP